jgi:hypothetical protein
MPSARQRSQALYWNGLGSRPPLSNDFFIKPGDIRSVFFNGFFNGFESGLDSVNWAPESTLFTASFDFVNVTLDTFKPTAHKEAKKNTDKLEYNDAVKDVHDLI